MRFIGMLLTVTIYLAVFVYTLPALLVDWVKFGIVGGRHPEVAFELGKLRGMDLTMDRLCTTAYIAAGLRLITPAKKSQIAQEAREIKRELNQQLRLLGEKAI